MGFCRVSDGVIAAFGSEDVKYPPLAQTRRMRLARRVHVDGGAKEHIRRFKLKWIFST